MTHIIASAVMLAFIGYACWCLVRLRCRRRIVLRRSVPSVLRGSKA